MNHWLHQFCCRAIETLFVARRVSSGRGWLIAICCGSAFLSTSNLAAERVRVKLKRLDTAIDAAAEYLVAQGLPNGQFRYRVNTNPAVRVLPKYNMLRHAGTMYALSQYQRLRPSPPVKQVLRTAAGFLDTQIGEVQDVPEVLAVWSDPRVHLGRDSRRAKLGGTGLGLVALCPLQSLDADRLPKQRLEWMGNFLLFMQNEDGGFYSFYVPGPIGRDDAWMSLYYPGEAALGLLMLDELHPDFEWRLGAYEALRYLAQIRKGQEEVPADHWTLIATEKLLQSQKEPSPVQIDEDLLLSHAVQIVRFMLQEQKGQNGHPMYDGCFSGDGRVTPTSTRLEGLLAALQFLPPAQRAFRREIEQACHGGLHFVLGAQHTGGKAKGGVPRAVKTIHAEHPGWTPTFNDRVTEIRIDYVQHALSAMIGYRTRFFRNAPAKQE